MTTQSDAFLSKFYPVAQEISQQTGVPVERILGQAGLESGWKTDAPGNNMFGVKADKSWTGKSQMLDTTEDFGKGPMALKQNFRSYENPEDSFRDWAKVLEQDNFKSAQEPGISDAEYAKRLKAGGYATGANYADSLAKTIASTRNSLFGANGDNPNPDLPPPVNVAGGGAGTSGSDPPQVPPNLSNSAPSSSYLPGPTGLAQGPKPTDPWASIGKSGMGLLALGAPPQAQTAGLLSTPIHKPDGSQPINPFAQSIFG